MGKFIIKSGVMAGRKFRLEPGAKIVLGREQGDLKLADSVMSRRHCVIECHEDGDFVEDVGSSNGTFVNGLRIASRQRLEGGDVVVAGQTEIAYLGDEPASQAIASEAPGTGIEGSPKRSIHDRKRLTNVKRAAMGISDGQMISAKGKFCEACGEAIFVKDGASDDGEVIDGLYLCRMCALIAAKQKEIGGDFLPSYAKIVGGRLGSDESGSHAELEANSIEEEEFSLDMPAAVAGEDDDEAETSVSLDAITEEDLCDVDIVDDDLNGRGQK